MNFEEKNRIKKKCAYSECQEEFTYLQHDKAKDYCSFICRLESEKENYPIIFLISYLVQFLKFALIGLLGILGVVIGLICLAAILGIVNSIKTNVLLFVAIILLTIVLIRKK